MVATINKKKINNLINHNKNWIVAFNRKEFKEKKISFNTGKGKSNEWMNANNRKGLETKFERKNCLARSYR